MRRWWRGAAGRWYVPAALGGNRTNGRYSGFRALAAGLASLALAGSVTACGDSSSSSSGSGDAEGTYDVEVTRAEFPAQQRLGQTSLMTIGVKNTGERTIPALSVTISVAGEEGETSSLPFAIHDPQPDLAQPDRPVWVLEEDFPRFVGSSKNAGTSSPNDKSFDFGALKAGDTAAGVWKLSAVRDGRFTVRYEVDADLSGAAKAESADGVKPGGTFAVRITDVTPDLRVTDSGEVVEAGQGERKAGQGERKKDKDRGQ